MKRILVAAGLVLALGAAVALAQGSPEIRVVPAGKSSESVDLDGRNPDVVDRDYVIRSGQNAHTEENVDGYSIKRVLAIAGVRDLKGYVEIEGDGKVLLDRPNLRDDAYDDGPPIFFYDDEGVLTFLQPVRDTNNGKGVFASSDGPFVVREHDEQLLNLRVKASETEVHPGDTVDLEAVLRQDSGSNLAPEIEWTASGLTPTDADPETGTSASYKFQDEGVAEISASVSDENETTAADSVKVQVGDPVDSNQNQTGGGFNSSYSAPDTGPYYGGQGAATPDYSTQVPDTGAAQGAAKPPPQIEEGEEVTGELLSETGVYVPPPAEEIIGVQEGTFDDGTDWTTPGIALGATMVVGLLGFGAGREFERLRIGRLRNLLPS